VLDTQIVDSDEVNASLTELETVRTPKFNPESDNNDEPVLGMLLGSIPLTTAASTEVANVEVPTS